MILGEGGKLAGSSPVSWREICIIVSIRNRIDEKGKKEEEAIQPSRAGEPEKRGKEAVPFQSGAEASVEKGGDITDASRGEVQKRKGGGNPMNPG